MSADTCQKTLDRDIALHADHAVTTSRQTYISDIAAAGHDLKIICSHMGMRTQNGTHSTLEKMQQHLLFTAGFSMHIDDNVGDTF